MPQGNGKAFGIIAILIGASGLGLGLYLVLGDEDPIPIGTLQNVVGLWETIEGGPASSYYLEFGDIQINESGYFNLTGANRNLTLTQPGWYKFSIRFLWDDLSTGQSYLLRLYKNSTIEHIIDYYQWPASNHRAVDKSIYVQSDGDDVFYFQCFTTSVSHQVGSQQEYNQLVLEYVKEM